MPYKRQRIRDPLHNLIEFKANEFEDVMFRVLQTRPFQRLRRVKQLGFSEFVYPGATHTRFAHSVGVFHTARMLMHVIKEHLPEREFKSSLADRALAAALVHDLGHGPFSHAFEDVGRRLKLKMASHETLSDSLIRDSEVSQALKELGSGFASDVADIVGSKGPRSIYAAVVSSQFDADRLDYVRRDRLMTGTHHGAIDFEWLLSNIEVGEVPHGVDEARIGHLKTFVLGPKAIHAAESYLLGLFQLYPTVYFHKATRGAEKLFSEILSRVVELVRQDSVSATGLSDNHPLALFAKEPDKIENVLNLDDTVVWGALSMMAGARDPTVSNFSGRLRDRRLYKCIDLQDRITDGLASDAPSKLVNAAKAAVLSRVDEWIEPDRSAGPPRILVDKATREIYREIDESKGPLNKIFLRGSDRKVTDVAKLSRIVAAIRPFELCRLYTAAEDSDAISIIENAIAEEIKKCET